ncbi:MAG TPA: hypothetical protein VLD86_02730, partial [Ilumatobacteraceae bacterium]|nr:hypothetical protein [Ilumatobacteraceae bacterium]
ASDVYSLGVLIHELFSGMAPPIDADLPTFDSPAAAVVARATNIDPQRRHASVEELAGDLRQRLVGRVDTSAVFVPTRNPYRGLAAFEQADAADFFGRERATAEMIAVLTEQPLVLVVGPSGIGKSSAVKAGLLPALACGAIAGSESWLVTEMVPGRSPLGQLAAALGRVATDALPDIVGDLLAATRSLDDIVAGVAPSNVVVLVIDQLEELFTETTDDRERRAFLQMLVDVANETRGAVRILATMRADFFDRPLAYPGFADAIKERTVVLGAMTVPELAEAVSRPAAGVGIEVDPALVDRLTSDAALQPGSLPLLQHVMADLFARRTSNTIGIGAYLESGGLTGAIGRQADAIYEGLDHQHQDVARRLFLRLVNVSDEGEDTRRRARRTELEQTGIAAEDLDVVLDAFGGQRLLTFDRDQSSRTPTVEVAHEALLSEWDRLKGWIDDAREDLLTRRRLELATNEWINAGCDASFLIVGGRLELAETWAERSRFELSNDERRFLATSRHKVERDRKVRSRRRRLVVTVLAVVAVAAMVMASIVFVQRRRSDRQAAATRSAELAGLATLAIDEDPERAILLGLAAMRSSEKPSADLLSALQGATQSMRLISKITDVMQVSMDQRHDGSLLTVDRLDQSGYLLIDPGSGTTVADVSTALPITYRGLSFDPTGTSVAVALDHVGHPGSPAIELI